MTPHRDAKAKRRAERERELAGKILALPERKFGVILADPPWRFEPWSRETGMDRAADNHYPTSTLDEIKALDVPSIAAPNCALFLWATAPMLPQALEVMTAWGFEYKSNVVWDKAWVGTGYWFRNSHEHLLLGTRGKIPAPAAGDQWRSIQGEAVRRHSVKPFWSHAMIETYFPNLPKVELYARTERAGWTVWGAEVAEIA